MRTTKRIFSLDPAIDRTDEKAVEKALEHFHATGERNGLPLKEGRLPAVWHLRSLTRRAYGELSTASMFELFRKLQRGQSALADQAAFNLDQTALQFALVNVENATDVDGRPLKLDFEASGGEKALTAKSLDELFEAYGADLFNELGQEAVKVSRPVPR